MLPDIPVPLVAFLVPGIAILALLGASFFTVGQRTAAIWIGFIQAGTTANRLLRLEDAKRMFDETKICSITSIQTTVLSGVWRRGLAPTP